MIARILLIAALLTAWEIPQAWAGETGVRFGIQRLAPTSHTFSPSDYVDMESSQTAHFGVFWREGLVGALDLQTEIGYFGGNVRFRNPFGLLTTYTYDTVEFVSLLRFSHPWEQRHLFIGTGPRLSYIPSSQGNGFRDASAGIESVVGLTIGSRTFEIRYATEFTPLFDEALFEVKQVIVRAVFSLTL